MNLSLHSLLAARTLVPVVGLAGGAMLSAWLAERRGIAGDRVWGFSLVFVLTAVLSARLLLIAFHFQEFLRHPFWMLGVTGIREPGFTVTALLLGFGAGCAYVGAWRLPVHAFADALAPGVALALAFGALGRGVPGQGTLAASALAHQPWWVTLAFPLLQAVGLVVGLVCFWRCGLPGRAAVGWLLFACLGAMVVEQLLPLPSEVWLLGGAYSLLDLVAVFGLLLAVLLWRTGPGGLRADGAQ